MSHAPAAPLRWVVVMGLMATGKTSVGRAIAERLGWAHSDSDETIEAETGLTVAELQHQIGDDAMHEREARHLLNALSGRRRTVVSAAASVIDDDRCLAALDRPAVIGIWLCSSPEVRALRLAEGGHRPAFGQDPVVVLTEQARARDPRYAAHSAITIAIDGRAVDEVVTLAMEALRQRAGLEGGRTEDG